MPPKMDVSHDEMRKMILDSAEDLIMSGGITALSARKISSMAGCALGTIYNMFKNMDEIALVVLSRAIERLTKKLSELPQQPDPEMRLRAFASTYVDFMSSDGGIWRALLDFRRNTDMPAPDWYIAHIRKLTGMVSGCFAEMSEDHDVPEATNSALLLWSSIYGVSTLDGEGRLPTVVGRPLRDLVSDLVDIHVLAYRAKHDATSEPENKPGR